MKSTTCSFFLITLSFFFTYSSLQGMENKILIEKLVKVLLEYKCITQDNALFLNSNASLYYTFLTNESIPNHHNQSIKAITLAENLIALDDIIKSPRKKIQYLKHLSPLTQKFLKMMGSVKSKNQIKSKVALEQSITSLKSDAPMNDFERATLGFQLILEKMCEKEIISSTEHHKIIHHQKSKPKKFIKNHEPLILTMLTTHSVKRYKEFEAILKQEFELKN